ncbi:hypothetical protein ERO13_D10G215250v2 [Gossypium hirsutum]|nr:hypothetical protein ERO13_D10G215250v2 [Gossypium hirsutum]
MKKTPLLLQKADSPPNLHFPKFQFHTSQFSAEEVKTTQQEVAQRQHHGKCRRGEIVFGKHV